MNKFEEYKEFQSLKQASGINDEWGENFRKCWTGGFDAAVALDLPVKFMEWKCSYCTQKEYPYKYRICATGQEFDSIKELYQYWIGNIYKPE